jgi:hypothetical protein
MGQSESSTHEKGRSQDQRTLLVHPESIGSLLDINGDSRGVGFVLTMAPGCPVFRSFFARCGIPLPYVGTQDPLALETFQGALRLFEDRWSRVRHRQNVRRI